MIKFVLIASQKKQKKKIYESQNHKKPTLSLFKMDLVSSYWYDTDNILLHIIIVLLSCIMCMCVCVLERR